MRRLLAEEILAAWEAGQLQSPAERALILLGRACPDQPPEALAGLTLGQRDRRLLQLRAASIGRALNGVARCPACDCEVGIDADVNDLIERAGEARARVQLESRGCRVQFRPPDSGDLLAIAACKDESEARASLLGRCVLDARRGGVPIAPDELPDEVIGALEEAIGECDPLSETLFHIDCPECGERWVAELDVAAFVWQELRSLALGLLDEVNVLARAYGWSETDVLALSPARRGWYVQRVSG
jgi:hypothetical protein